jgi:hypothetical protein
MQRSQHLRLPADLQTQVRHAARFAHTLSVLQARLLPADMRIVWVVGRADEVNAFVAETRVEWTAGGLVAARASRSIEAYVAELHQQLLRRFGPKRQLACCERAHRVDPDHEVTLSHAYDTLAARRFRPRTDTIPAPPMR